MATDTLKFPPPNRLLTDVPFGFTAGDDFTRTLTAKADDVPVDISAYTFAAQIRPRAGSDDLVATFTIDDTDAATGVLVLSLDSATTETIPRGVYRFDMARTDSGGKVRYVLAGHVVVEAPVTELA